MVSFVKKTHQKNRFAKVAVFTGYYKINIIVMTNERGQNTQSKGERVKIPILTYIVDKRECLKILGPT